MNLTSGASNNSAAVTSGASVVALIEKGNALEEQGRPEEAMECYEAAVQADPRCARAHLNRGNILLASARIEEARDAYQLAVTCDSQYAAAYFNLGNLNCRVREYEQALRNYGIAIRIKPDFADAFVAMGNALDDLERNAEAIASYQRALAIRPDYAEVYFNLGVLAMKKGELTEAAVSAASDMRLILAAAPDGQENTLRISWPKSTVWICRRKCLNKPAANKSTANWIAMRLWLGSSARQRNHSLLTSFCRPTYSSMSAT